MSVVAKRAVGEQLGLRLSEDDDGRVESYGVRGDQLVRTVRLRSGEFRSSSVDVIDGSSPVADLCESFDQAFLRSQTRPIADSVRGSLRLCDLFSGCGGASIGVDEAARALQLDVHHVLAADINRDALATYTRNFAPQYAIERPIEECVDSELGERLSPAERAFKRKVGQVDIVFGGPPCQGHSDLNNHTRREDPKNALFARMARFSEVIEPSHVVIENVPGVRHDRTGVFDLTIDALQRLGYSTDAFKVRAETIGVPQRRHRTVVVASTSGVVKEGFLKRAMDLHALPVRTVEWACQDLLDAPQMSPLDTHTVQSAVSRERIDWLYDNNEHDLPDRLRPDCHRTKAHTYKSVYGRLWWDRPSWTITTGFPVMGQGRFLHPLERRSITAHEAARLQFFPDFFDFGVMNRRGYAQQIGNAVPSRMAYVIALELLR